MRISLNVESNKYTMDLEDRFAAWVLYSRIPRDARVIACDQQIGDDPNIVVLEHYFTWIRVQPGRRETNEGVENSGR